jgi:hypothetical protein
LHPNVGSGVAAPRRGRLQTLATCPRMNRRRGSRRLPPWTDLARQPIFGGLHWPQVCG